MVFQKKVEHDGIEGKCETKTSNYPLKVFVFEKVTDSDLQKTCLILHQKIQTTNAIVQPTVPDKSVALEGFLMLALASLVRHWLFLGRIFSTATLNSLIQLKVFDQIQRITAFSSILNR